ncbi:neurofilament medium polypeptide-like [Saccostrea cucullata]|uniref:neurofilament medium polypeptide-like n=1 Tax=Saccostrea cuccullata TaxID=36930 RepID=UPI002ED516B3
MEEFLTVFNCLKDTFTNSTELATKIVLDEVECEDEISEIQSKIISRSKAIKDALDIIVHDNIENLTAIKRSLMSDFQTRKAILSDFISKIKYLLNKYDDVESTELPVEFIMTQKEKVDAMKKLLNIPRFSEPLMPCYEQIDFQKSDIEILLPRVSNLGIACRERSPRTVSTATSSERSPERVTTERSPERETTEQSPERVTTEQSPERATTEQSPERVTTEQSPERMTTERSPERPTTKQLPERVTTEQSPERMTTEQSP